MDYLSLCLVCKDENHYLPEWLDYHILLGVDRFYIYDNESHVSLRTSLAAYIQRGWVVVIDAPGQAIQLNAYDHCLRTFGAHTFWLGFIDTDEFLLPKTNSNLKDLLKEFEPYAGLAVSSLFFGSNGHLVRPLQGQLAAYTTRVDAAIHEYQLVKSIVQPRWVIMPNSPHDFIYQENQSCVNEVFLPVEYQRFPTHTEKIQLNHYYCRSAHEIKQKLQRGNAQSVAWQRDRFDTLNHLATTPDDSAPQLLARLLDEPGQNSAAQVTALFEKMARAAHQLSPNQPPSQSSARMSAIRPELALWLQKKAAWEAAKAGNDLANVLRLGQEMLQLHPHYIHLLVVMAVDCLAVNDPASAWQYLSHAWQLSPNKNYNVLSGMVFFFLWTDNFTMAEKTSRLILDFAPTDVQVTGLLVSSLIGLGRRADALQVGLPLLALAGSPGWQLSDRLAISLFNSLAGYLLEDHNYLLAQRLWEQAVSWRPNDPGLQLQLAQTCLLAGDPQSARRWLASVLALAPQNEQALQLLRQVENPASPSTRAA
jgi:tetratricopeptide (TPR) repeat protein